jgi:DNA-binding MarR family transcriptional regulator/GNAT superfamily N-acetyltransferase
MSEAISNIRAFNRTITRRLGVLNEKYLGRDRPYVESRLLFEIGATGATVRDLRERLGLDSGFLSRVLRALERKRLATTQPSPQDGRVKLVRLSRSGRSELRRIDALSDRLAQSILDPLSERQGQRLLAAMQEVERLVRASSVEFAVEDPRSADTRKCLARYFAELEGRFRGGFDPRKGTAPDDGVFIPPHGCLLIARLHGEAVGCGALRTFKPGIGEIKRMWIAPDARGLGLGTRLLAELEREARRRRMRAVRLDTNKSLREALQLYRASGYRQIARFNDNPYAHHWFEKTLR